MRNRASRISAAEAGRTRRVEQRRHAAEVERIRRANRRRLRRMVLSGPG